MTVAGMDLPNEAPTPTSNLGRYQCGFNVNKQVGANVSKCRGAIRLASYLFT